MTTWESRNDFLEVIWIPFVKHKRWELEWWRGDDLAKLDQEAKSTDPPRRDRRASPYVPRARRQRNQQIFRKKNPKAGLRRVPKKLVRCSEGTSVPEAREVDTEADFKFGPRDALGPESCEALHD